VINQHKGAGGNKTFEHG